MDCHLRNLPDFLSFASDSDVARINSTGGKMTVQEESYSPGEIAVPLNHGRDDLGVIMCVGKDASIQAGKCHY